jgi:hypothetical protein
MLLTKPFTLISDIVNQLKSTGCTSNSELKSNWTQKYDAEKLALVYFLFVDFEENANPNLLRITRTGTGKLALKDISTKVYMAFKEARISFDPKQQDIEPYPVCKHIIYMPIQTSVKVNQMNNTSLAENNK